jgi:EXLDI family protein
MPNRTIYVADADLPIFERAQQLAGGNLSATIAAALRRFVEREEARRAGFEEIKVKVGKVARVYKRFWGRLLLRGNMHRPDDCKQVIYQVYQTPKGKLAVYVREFPDWEAWQYWTRAERRQKEWTCWPQDYDYRLEIYDEPQQMRGQVPSELYEAVCQALKAENEEDGIEFLDI